MFSFSSFNQLKRILRTAHQSHCFLSCNKNLSSNASGAGVNETISQQDFLFEKIPLERIRNFSIIAHVDHGKSTLADRLLEMTGAIKRTVGKSQVLDNLQVEKERGITVKAQTATLLYMQNGEPFMFNLIDTPGHVDFAHEVARSLEACSGVILLVDANHGVQAQTVANYHLAVERGQSIIPVLNKIDLRNADPDRVCRELEKLFGIDPSTVLKISAKNGIGIEAVLERIVTHIPAPVDCSPSSNFRAVLFDSWYDRYRGVLNLIYVRDGKVAVGQEIVSAHTGKTFTVKSISLLRPNEVSVQRLMTGQVGLIACNMRSIRESVFGDTIYLRNQPVKPYKPIINRQPMVYAGIYPNDQTEYVALKSAIEKLILNDSVVSIVPDTSPALGQGWRLGFLGLLHLEVFCQRLQQEHGTEPIITAPSVTYRIKLRKKLRNAAATADNIIEVSNPSLLPEPSECEEYYEPYVLGTIITPVEYLGGIISLCVEKRSVQRSATAIDESRMILEYAMPLSEVVINFHDNLKAITSGYASFDYKNDGYQPANIVKLNILLNGKRVDELCTIVHASQALRNSREIVGRLKNLIPRQMVQIAIQASVGSKILARETLKAYRKDVTAKLYGGDVTRRMKLLRQQSDGKKKMRSIANINVPRDTFINVLKM